MWHGYMTKCMLSSRTLFKVLQWHCLINVPKRSTGVLMLNSQGKDRAIDHCSPIKRHVGCRLLNTLLAAQRLGSEASLRARSSSRSRFCPIWNEIECHTFKWTLDVLDSDPFKEIAQEKLLSGSLVQVLPILPDTQQMVIMTSLALAYSRFPL
jgi:hypothetical protein